MPHRLDRKQDEAVDFLRSTIRQCPGEITLLSIGPFSNVALLFAIDPEIPFLLKDFISMAGVFRRDFDTEWNCVCDPVAAAMVAHSRRPRHSWVGLDVSLECTMDRLQCEDRFKGPLLELVLKMATKWFEREGKITFHDPLAAAAIFLPDLLKFDQGRVQVNPEKGQTNFINGEGYDFIATEVDAPRFFEEFFAIMK
jgi:purine nucleosidase